MIIREESFLKSRDTRIHEAGHFGVGTLLRLPMAGPEVFRDGSGGIVNLDWDNIRETAKELEGKEASHQTNVVAATRIATMYLAGFAAECIASDTDTTEIVGAQSHDFMKACEALRLVDAPVEKNLKKAWSDALKVLNICWPAVIEAAALIPVTDGTHRPPKFH